MATWLTEKPVSRDVLQAHLPQGKAWAGFRITGKIAYRFMTGLARTHQNVWRALALLSNRIDYRTSTEMLSEWETALGLPDKCLPSTSSLADRREWIAFRLDKKRWNTEADWHALAALYGVTIRITQGWLVQRPSVFAALFPLPIRTFPALGRFRIYIDVLNEEFGGFPYDGSRIEDDRFAIPFRSRSTRYEGFRCIIERVAPANVLIIWNEFPRIAPNGNGLTFSEEFDEEYS